MSLTLLHSTAKIAYNFGLSECRRVKAMSELLEFNVPSTHKTYEDGTLVSRHICKTREVERGKGSNLQPLDW